MAQASLFGEGLALSALCCLLQERLFLLFRETKSKTPKAANLQLFQRLPACLPFMMSTRHVNRDRTQNSQDIPKKKRPSPLDSNTPARFRIRHSKRNASLAILPFNPSTLNRNTEERALALQPFKDCPGTIQGYIYQGGRTKVGSPLYHLHIQSCHFLKPSAAQRTYHPNVPTLGGGGGGLATFPFLTLYPLMVSVVLFLFPTSSLFSYILFAPHIAGSSS